MQIHRSVTPINGVFKAQIGLATESPEHLSPLERDALAKLGEPIVDVGGEIPNGEGTYELAEAERRFPSQFPVTQVFSLEDFEDAGTRAAAWTDEILARITTAMTDLVTEAATISTEAFSKVDYVNTTP